ncbi:MAG: ABC transporter substrate-binding protein [Lachnospiraceae bacterium]|nr:ABC transporter substrate-binding protein [Lachnospiraceae bacterium]
MKKKLSAIITLLVVAAMAIALTACGGSSEGGAPAGGAAPAGSGSSAAPAAGGKLVMATNAEFPPYEFKEGDNFAGIDVEIAGAIANKLGLELEIADVEFGSIIGGVQSGKFDMGMAGMTVTEERLQSVNFSTSYATGIQSIIVKDGSEIASPDDLAGHKIGVQADTTGDIYCSGDFGEENVTAYKTGADAVQALIAGKVDCVVIDNEPAKSYVAANADQNLKVLDTAYAEEQYAIAINKDNTALLDQINAALEELTADGTIPGIIAKYIG